MKFQKIYDIPPRICVTCGKTFIQVNRKSIVQKFCNRKCYRQTDEAKKKIGDYNRGRQKSHRGKPRPFCSGEKSHFWKGGVSKLNRTERQNLTATIEYRNFRREVLKRDNYKCVVCGDHSYKNRLGGHCDLQVDHIKPFSIYPELRMDLSNARTLCKKCHYNTDTYGGLKIYRMAEKAIQ